MRHHYTKELLQPIIQKSKTWGEVCKLLKIKPCSGAQTHVQKRSADFNIDSSHFLGQSWAKGLKKNYKNPIQDYLSNKIKIPSDRLKKRLFKEGLKEKKCENCGLTEWLGEEPVFELDHINNNHFDNHLENLRILCRNCHGLKTRKARMVKKKTRTA